MNTAKYYCILICLIISSKCGAIKSTSTEKRALSTVCVEIKPSVNDKNQESYFMCKGKAPIKIKNDHSEDYGYPQRYRLNLEEHDIIDDGYFNGKYLYYILKYVCSNLTFRYSYEFCRKTNGKSRTLLFHQKAINICKQG